MRYYPFCKFVPSREPLSRCFVGKQIHPLGLTRWGMAIWWRGRTLALGIERNDGPFWKVAVLPPRQAPVTPLPHTKEGV